MVPSGNLDIKWNKHKSKRLYLHNFFCSIREMLLNLLVVEFEHLESVRHRRLSGLGFMEVVDDALIGEGLLQIAVAEVHYCVAVREGLSSHFVAEDHFFLPIQVYPLDFAICTCCLALDGRVLWIIVVIFRWHAQVPFITATTALLRSVPLHWLCLFRNFNFKPILGTLWWTLFSDLLFNFLEDLGGALQMRWPWPRAHLSSVTILLAPSSWLFVVDLILNILEFFIIIVMLVGAVFQRCEGFYLFLHLVVYFFDFLFERWLSISSRTLSFVLWYSHSNLGLDSTSVCAINQIVGVTSKREPFPSWKSLVTSVVELMLFWLSLSMLLHVSLFVALFNCSLIFLGITTSKISISLFTELPELQNQALDFLSQAGILFSQSSVVHPESIILISEPLVSSVQFRLSRIQLPHLLSQLFQISILSTLLLKL